MCGGCRYDVKAPLHKAVCFRKVTGGSRLEFANSIFFLLLVLCPSPSLRIQFLIAQTPSTGLQTIHEESLAAAARRRSLGLHSCAGEFPLGYGCRRNGCVDCHCGSGGGRGDEADGGWDECDCYSKGFSLLVLEDHGLDLFPQTGPFSLVLVHYPQHAQWRALGFV